MQGIFFMKCIFKNLICMNVALHKILLTRKDLLFMDSTQCSFDWKSFAVLLKTTKNMKVKPSESFPVYGIEYFDSIHSCNSCFNVVALCLYLYM